MKIYFSGSITGGRDDVHLYAEIITILKNYGVVLTEHIGNLQMNALGQTHMTPEEVYTKDTNWIKEADIVIAEVTMPSLGVGYELGFAEALKKKIVCIYRNREGKQVSRMVLGNGYNECYEYKEVSDLEPVFAKVFAKHDNSN